VGENGILRKLEILGRHVEEGITDGLKWRKFRDEIKRDLGFFLFDVFVFVVEHIFSFQGIANWWDGSGWRTL
jgi:hypothetical protein